MTNGLATTNWVSTNVFTTAQLLRGGTTNGLGCVLSSYTNVVIDLSRYTNAEPLSFFIALTNNTTFAFVTNAPAGKSFFIEVQQGSGQYTVAFNTNLTTTAAYWVPPAFGQFLAMPTNSIRTVVSSLTCASGTIERMLLSGKTTSCDESFIVLNLDLPCCCRRALDAARYSGACWVVDF